MSVDGETAQQTDFAGFPNNSSSSLVLTQHNSEVKHFLSLTDRSTSSHSREDKPYGQLKPSGRQSFSTLDL